MTAPAYDPILYPTWEGINQTDYLIATYVIQAGSHADLVGKAAAIGIEQTTGSWTAVAQETADVRRKYAAKVIGLYSVPNYELIANLPKDQPRLFVLRLAYPWVNFYDNIPLLMSTVIGNISSMPNLKLVDLEFPESYVQQFKGPKFGIAGLREYLGVPTRPLLNNMIKPCTGIGPEVGADLLYNAAAGGVDWVKDDELIAGSPAFSPLEDRVRAYMAGARRADQEKGEKTIFTVNLTDEVTRLRDNAYRAIEAGANALMINVFANGWSALRMLAEDPNITVPVMAHSCFGGAMTVSPFQGISTEVAQKLARLAGADIVLNVAPSAKFNALFEKFIRVHQVVTSPMYHIKPSFGMVGGGVTPGMVPYLMKNLGNDFIIGAGAGIHAHPMGPKAGGKAFRLAIDAAMQGVDIRTAAKDSPELQAALDTWGVYGVDDYTNLYQIEE